MGTHATKAGEIRRRWYLVDAEGQTLGRLASEVAGILRGKWKPNYTPHLDVGDHVVIVNAQAIVLTGRKMTQKSYFRHSGHVGHARHISIRSRMQREPAEVVRDAVRGMLPHTRLGRQMLRKLKVYAGPQHPHAGQQPLPLQLGLHGKGYPAQEEALSAGARRAG